MFMLGLRQLRNARTGAYFSLAPFIGPMMALAMFRESFTLQLLAARVLMALGLWLYLAALALSAGRRRPHHLLQALPGPECLLWAGATEAYDNVYDATAALKSHRETGHYRSGMLMGWGKQSGNWKLVEQFR
jgi:hypothetical protein